MASAVLAGVVALVGIGLVALDTRRDAKAPELDSLSLPAIGRTEAQPSIQAAPVDSGVSSSGVSALRPEETAMKAAPARFDGPKPKAVAPPAALSAGGSQIVRQGGTWAVIIGVNDYPGSRSDLNSAVNDANDAVQALSQMGVPADRMITLRDGQATSRTVLAAVDWLADRTSTEAVAVFFFAGHVRKAGKSTEEMVLSDGSTVTDAQLARGLAKVPAARSWVAMAACYGGGFTEVLKPGRILTGAASADELAYESSAIGRSFMVEFMVRQAMVLDRAPETVQTAFDYAVAKIREEHPNREPVQFDNSDGRLSLRPPGVPTPPRKSEAAPREQAPPPPAESAPEPPHEPEPNCTVTGFVSYCD